MSQFRNVSDDVRLVAYGLAGPARVAPGEVVTVADDTDVSYANQPSIWAAVTKPAAKPQSKAAAV